MGKSEGKQHGFPAQLAQLKCLSVLIHEMEVECLFSGHQSLSVVVYLNGSVSRISGKKKADEQGQHEGEGRHKHSSGTTRRRTDRESNFSQVPRLSYSFWFLSEDGDLKIEPLIAGRKSHTSISRVLLLSDERSIP